MVMPSEYCHLIRTMHFGHRSIFKSLNAIADVQSAIHDSWIEFKWLQDVTLEA